MAAYDFTAPRLFVEADLAEGRVLPLERAQANYLLTVLRRAGSPISGTERIPHCSAASIVLA
jgi:16S rRNA (uracil1498-N3)-methyltransferase